MPSPQPVDLARYEPKRLTVTMSPVTDITGHTFSLNIRNLTGTLALQVTTHTVTDATNGVFYISLTGTQTSGLVAGTYEYDIWRTNSGSEARLCFGPLLVDRQQWQT